MYMFINLTGAGRPQDQLPIDAKNFSSKPQSQGRVPTTPASRGTFNNKCFESGKYRHELSRITSHREKCKIQYQLGITTRQLRSRGRIVESTHISPTMTWRRFQMVNTEKIGVVIIIVSKVELTRPKSIIPWSRQSRFRMQIGEYWFPSLTVSCEYILSLCICRDGFNEANMIKLSMNASNWLMRLESADLVV